jgi:hypothetical protein
VRARRRDEACHHSLAIEEHGACAALALGAAFLCAGQVEVFAQEAQECFFVPGLR